MDEVVILKGEKNRLKFKPSKLDKEVRKDDDLQAMEDNAGMRHGSNERSITAKAKIYEEKIIPPRERVLSGARFKGYRNYVIQDLVI